MIKLLNTTDETIEIKFWKQYITLVPGLENYDITQDQADNILKNMHFMRLAKQDELTVVEIEEKKRSEEDKNKLKSFLSKMFWRNRTTK